MARITRPAKPAVQEGLEHGLPLPEGAQVQKNGKVRKNGREIVVCAAGKHWHAASGKGCAGCGTSKKGGFRGKKPGAPAASPSLDDLAKAAVASGIEVRVGFVEKSARVADADLDALAARAVGMARSPFPEESHDEAMTDVQRAIWDECEALAEMLIAKNRAYGNSALDPVRIFSKAPPEEQIRVRLDDKLSRLMRGDAAGEDTELDLLGYLVLLRVHRRAGR